MADDFRNPEENVILLEIGSSSDGGYNSNTFEIDPGLELPSDSTTPLSVTPHGDWFEEALKTPTPHTPKRLVAAWDDDEDEDEDVDEDPDTERELPEDGVVAEPEEEDPFFDFDEDDFDDDFDDDFEEELEEEYDIEPDDDGMLEGGDESGEEEIDPEAPLDDIAAEDE